MKFIEPKRATAVRWYVSDQTKAIVENYEKYNGFSEEDVVAHLIILILTKNIRRLRTSIFKMRTQNKFGE